MNRFVLLVIFSGSLLVSISGTSQTITSAGPGPWNVGATWVGGVVPTNANSTLVQINHALSIPNAYAATAVGITIGGGAASLNINSGGSLSFTGVLNQAGVFPPTASKITINGTMIVQEGATITPGTNPGKIAVNNGGIYRHNYTTSAGTVYNATWATGATLEITGYTSNALPPAGLNQSFYNVVWNCTAQAGGFVDLDGSGLSTINGDFSILSTNFNGIALGNNSNITIAVGGNFTVNDYIALSLGSGNLVVDLSGNLTFSALGDIIGNYGAGTSKINFKGGSTQVFSSQAVINTAVDYEIFNGSTVQVGASDFISTLGSFTTQSGSKLQVGSTAGLTTGTSTGNVRVGGTRTYNAGTNIVYNGTAAQNLGNEWGGSGALNGIAVNLEINNTNGDVTNNIIGATSLVGDLTLTNGALNIGNSNSLDVQSNFNVTNGTIGGLSTSNLTFSGSGTLGTLTMASGAQSLNNLTITRSGDLVLGSNLTIGGTLSLTGNLDFSGQSLTITGSSINNGGGGGLKSSNTSDLTIGGSGFSGSVPYAGSGNQLNNLTFNSTGGATYTWNSAVTINNNVNMNQGTLTHTSGLTMAANSTFVKGAGSITSNSPNAVSSYNVIYNTAGPTSLELPSSTTALNDLTVSVSGTVALQSSTTVNGNLLLNSGTLDASTNDLTVAGSNWMANGGTFTIDAANTVTLSNAGTLTMGGSSIGGTQFGSLVINSGTTLAAPAANLNVSGTWTNNGVFTAGTGTITFNGASQNLDANGQSFNNVTFAGTGTKSLVSSVTGTGSLTINSGVTLDAAASSNVINVSGSWINNGTFTPSGNTVTFNGTNQSIDANAQPFHNLSFSGSGTKTLAGTLDVNNNLSIGSGVTLSTGGSGYSIFIGGNWINDGIFTAGLGTVTFDGTTTVSGSSISSFRNVEISGSLTASALSMNVAGYWLYNSGSFTANGGTINFNGANQNITSGAQSFNNIIIAGSNTKTLQDNLDVNGNLTLNAGTLSVGTDRQINLAGNFDASGGGTFTAANGKIVFDGTTQSITGGGVSFNDIDLASSTTATFSGNLNLTGDWNAIAGSSYSAAGTTSFTGSGAQSITSNGGSFGAVSIAGSGTKTLQDALDVNGALTISSTLSVGTDNALNVSGNWDSGSGTFTPASGLVTLDGAAQNITSGTNSFNSLTVAGTGTKTLQDALDVNGGLTISSTLDVGANNNINLVGDWTNNGSFIAGTAKVIFDGNGTSNVLGTGTTQFNDLDVIGSTTTEIETTHNLSGTLTLVGSTSAFDADGSGGAGVFTLVSSADNPTVDGNIAAITTPANLTGNITVQRFMASEGGIWRYISAPVTGQTVADWQTQFPITGSFSGADDLGGANNPSVYIYDETESAIGGINDGWTAYPSAANTETIDQGVGYSAFMRASDGQITINQRGPVNSGDFDFTVDGNLSYTTTGSAADDGWNLLGNPYPSAIDWNAMWDNEVGSNLDGTMSIRDNPGGVYATWNASTNSGTNGGTKNIAIGQGFWVHATGSPSLTLNESEKTTDTHSFFRTAQPENFIRITLNDGTNRDETLIHFFDDALPGIDKYDAYKLQNDIFNLSTLMDDGTELVINAIGSTTCDSEVSLKISNINQGNYTLDFSELASFNEIVTVYLKDNFTGTLELVTDGYQYPFTVTSDSASFGASRFKVTFDKPEIDTELEVTGTDICQEEDASIIVTGSELGVNYYAVKNGIGVSDTLAGNGNDLLIMVNDSLAVGSHEFNIVANNSCGELTLTNSATVNVNEVYQVSQVVGDQSCGPNTLLLQAAGAPDAGGYRWYNNFDDTLPIAETKTGEFTTPSIDTSQSFYVAVYNQLGCEGDRMAIEATIINLGLPLIELDTVDYGVYKLVSSYDQGNQWYLYGELIDGATANSLLVTEPGIYSVSVEQNGCSIVSDDYNYEDLITGLSDALGESIITVAPNPFKTNFEVSIPAESFNLRKTSITIFDMSGKIVYFDKKVRNKNISINLGGFNNGIYLLNVYDGEIGTQYKLIKE